LRNRVIPLLVLLMALTATAGLNIAAAQDRDPPVDAGSLDQSDDKNPEVQPDPVGDIDSAAGNNTEAPVLSPDDEFKPSEDVSEDLSIPFPVDI
jgi:hypothetical protein